MEVKYRRGCVYAIEYHIVWCVKYKREVLNGEIADYLQELLKEIAIKSNFKVESLEVVSDHVHVLVSANPQQTIPNIVKFLKGISARKMFLKFPQIKTKLWDTKNSDKVGQSSIQQTDSYAAQSTQQDCPTLSNSFLGGGHLWNPSYFVATVSENTESQIKKYIESQNDSSESLQS